MRSGLNKPGALPLLALVVFSLLTLVPSLPNLYNSKFADFSFYTGAARQLPLLQDSVNEVLPRAHALSEPRKSWIRAATPRSRSNHPPLTARLGPATIPASETIAVANKSRLSSIAREPSFLFGRRARAFRSYFIQQLDDYPFLTSFSNRSLPAESTHPSSTIAINDSLPTSDNSPATLDPPDHLSDSIQDPLLPFSAFLLDMCQQACHVAIDMGKRVGLRGAEYARSLLLPEQPLDAPAKLIRPSIVSKQDQFVVSEEGMSQQKVGAEDSTDAAAGLHSQELHGSSMAVVIGIVAGIMWF
ncbi:uncharacterized protein N7515_005000 [Penicillium bovifimosum]|uniref:Uncharacterized protein n=1 Tax=Penicillium bovifimosum TaxID=126998 RepID=A0A9W9L4G4_9EURO|nr:uncharacterized protein N7515_005000 [Penicillium bovifimosum]KAJ5135722.1 hypothetical protein N7515_005000 [Penicillium bovifimosum]